MFDFTYYCYLMVQSIMRDGTQRTTDAFVLKIITTDATQEMGEGDGAWLEENRAELLDPGYTYEYLLEALEGDMNRLSNLVEQCVRVASKSNDGDLVHCARKILHLVSGRY